MGSTMRFFRSFMVIAGGIWLLSACTPKEAVPTSLAEARARLEGGFQVMKPDAAGPHPTVLFFHGASDMSWQPAYADIMKGFVDRGFATVFVDMYHGREASGSTVRTGGLLPRATAGDVMVAAEWVRAQPWAAADRIGLFGISFGGATIMDSLVLTAPGQTPTSLLEKPAGGFDGVKAAALLSPWCMGDVMGFNLIRAVHEDFAHHLPMIAILPQADIASDAELCLDILRRNKARGMEIEMVKYDGAGHTFAQPVDDYGNPFPDYDARLAKDAFDRIYAFLEAKLM